MRKLLLLLPLILAGCDGGSDIQNERAYQEPPPQIGEPEPEQANITDDGWIPRIQGLPVVLNDILWSGGNFIAVGNSGMILTSDDGINWVQVVSGTGANLNTIASNGSDVLVVGHDGTVLLSTDHGESWIIKHSQGGINLYAVVVNDWQIVVGGRYPHTQAVFMMRSEDLGDTWTAIESFPQTLHWTTDLVYAGGLFVAATDIPRSTGGTRVWVSLDGKDWRDIVLQDDQTAGLYSILHDGNQFIVAGDYGAVFTSADGAHWVKSETPLEEISYSSAAWNGTDLMLAGGITWWYWWVGEPRFGPLNVGLSSSDGGQTWSTFNIDGYFESHGLAWGNGRFVAVGQASQLEREGAIYTSP